MALVFRPLIALSLLIPSAAFATGPRILVRNETASSRAHPFYSIYLQSPGDLRAVSLEVHGEGVGITSTVTPESPPPGGRLFPVRSLRNEKGQVFAVVFPRQWAPPPNEERRLAGITLIPPPGITVSLPRIEASGVGQD